MPPAFYRVLGVQFLSTLADNAFLIVAIARVMELTGGHGVDAAIEAVGVPETFELCAELIRAGGRVANVGVHGARSHCTSRSCGSATC